MEHRIRTHPKLGFTLVETVLYVALAGAVSVILLQSIGFLQDVRTRHVVSGEVNDQASWAMQRITDRYVAGVVQRPVSGEESDDLVFDDGWSVVVESGQLHEKTSTLSFALTSPEVLVSSVSFANRSSGAFTIVTVRFTASFRSGASAASAFQYERIYESSITSLQ